LHSQFGLDNRRGLSDNLNENLDWQHVGHDINGMTPITSGPQSQFAAILLESIRMTHSLNQLQKEVDIIIIDSPPLFSVDSQILASKVDGILLVVRQGCTVTAVARAMLDQLEASHSSLVIYNSTSGRFPMRSA
jgi:protein-tyrosine kinase